MTFANEFLLERVVHHVLKADPHAGRIALTDGVTAGLPATTLIAEVLWPTMECVEKLRGDAIISTRTYNGATRTLRGLLEMLERRLSRETSHGRSLFVLTAAGERGDLGADIVATLAEAQGWMVFFAGAGLPQEEVVYSLEQLRPDVVLMHGSSPQRAQETARLSGALNRAGLRPTMQVAATGGLTSVGSCRLGVDLAAAGPTAILELLALWPEHRLLGELDEPLTVSPETETDGGLDRATIRRMILRHLRSGVEGVN